MVIFIIAIFICNLKVDNFLLRFWFCKLKITSFLLQLCSNFEVFIFVTLLILWMLHFLLQFKASFFNAISKLKNLKLWLHYIMFCNFKISLCFAILKLHSFIEVLILQNRSRNCFLSLFYNLKVENWKLQFFITILMLKIQTF